MTDANALRDLIAAVEAGTAGWNAIASMCEAAGIGLPHSQVAASAYAGGSLDAARALHEALLPGWVARPTIGGASAGVTVWHCTVENWDTGDEIDADNMPSPARAWLLAILRAYLAQQEDSHER